jgi:hypothetical protein
MYQDYRDHHKQAEAIKLQNAGPEYTNLEDQSKNDLAWSIVSGLFSIGSFYIASRPLEVKIPVGTISVSTTSKGFNIALNF